LIPKEIKLQFNKKTKSCIYYSKNYSARKIFCTGQAVCTVHDSYRFRSDAEALHGSTIDRIYKIVYTCVCTTIHPCVGTSKDYTHETSRNNDQVLLYLGCCIRITSLLFLVLAVIKILATNRPETSASSPLPMPHDHQPPFPRLDSN
jgi:hypothetical protein